MPLEILSWNVNGYRAVLRNGFTDWFQRAKPNILCLQEVKAEPEQLTEPERAPKGYAAFWNPAKKKGYAGTATFTKLEPLSVSGIGQSEFDDEGRVQVLEFKEFTLINAYFPNSQPERKRIEYKINFCRAMQKLCNRLVKSGKNVVLCGDYNIAHTEIDLARPKQNVESPGFLPEERAEMTKFLKAGYVDTFRHFHPEPGHYSWWSYRSNARENNVGWRIDYHCVNRDFMDRIGGAKIHSDVHGADHCPVAVTIR